MVMANELDHRGVVLLEDIFEDIAAEIRKRREKRFKAFTIGPGNRDLS